MTPTFNYLRVNQVAKRLDCEPLDIVNICASGVIPAYIFLPPARGDSYINGSAFFSPNDLELIKLGVELFTKNQTPYTFKRHNLTTTILPQVYERFIATTNNGDPAWLPIYCSGIAEISWLELGLVNSQQTPDNYLVHSGHVLSETGENKDKADPYICISSAPNSKLFTGNTPSLSMQNILIAKRDIDLISKLLAAPEQDLPPMEFGFTGALRLIATQLHHHIESPKAAQDDVKHRESSVLPRFTRALLLMDKDLSRYIDNPNGLQTALQQKYAKKGVPVGYTPPDRKTLAKYLEAGKLPKERKGK